MKILVCHNSRETPVSLPAHAFATHRLERICLSSRQLTRMHLPRVLATRRAATIPIPTVSTCIETPEYTGRPLWAAPLTSIALMVAIVLLATWSTGLLHR